jgi:hypothetical protein
MEKGIEGRRRRMKTDEREEEEELKVKDEK